MPVLLNPYRYAAGTSAYAAAVLADSPSFYHRCNETSGTTAVDSSPNGRNGSYDGTKTFGATGLVTGDTAISVAGAGAVKQAYGAYMDGDMTCEGWFRVTSLTALQTYMGRSNTSEGSRWVFASDNADLRLYVWTSAGAAGTLTSTATLAINTTYHLAFTRSGDTWTIYVNGSAAGSFSQATSHNPSVSLTFGADEQAHYSRFISGTMDELAYYPTALSAGRIAAHYAAA
jgi:hypothetical protein